MAALSQGIVGGEMAWPLVIVGIAMGLTLILVKVKSPMLFSVGMYLPLETTFAIFIGGLVKGLVTKLAGKRDFNEAQKARVENAGVLAASGLIAGEALMGLGIAGVVAYRSDKTFPTVSGFEGIAPLLAIPVLALLVAYLVYIPLTKAGAADERLSRDEARRREDARVLDARLLRLVVAALRGRLRHEALDEAADEDRERRLERQVHADRE